MQQKFGVVADVVVVDVDVLFDSLSINVDVTVVDDKWEEGNNVDATDNCWVGVEINLLCILNIKHIHRLQNVFRNVFCSLAHFTFCC